jgi:glycosyltransferase involved in cell wall biosynthesis
MKRRWWTRSSRRAEPAPRVLVVIENVSFARDHRARKQVGSLLRRGYRVGVISRRDAANQRHAQPGLRLYQYPPPPERPGMLFFAIEYCYSLVAAMVLMIRARADGAFQLVQTGHPPDIYFLLAFPARLLGARLLIDQRDLSPEVYADRFGAATGAIPRILRTVERASHHIADGILCVNDSLAETTVARNNLSSQKVTVVGNGPLLASTEGREPNPALRDGFPHLVCWLGLIGPQDHADIAIAAAAHYRRELARRDALFVFIGAGEALADLRAQAAALDVADVVRFTGWLEEAQCFEYLATADLGLDSNLQPEVTPVKGLEYMAHGVPFVAFDLPETRAMAGSAARYVAPADPVAMAHEIARLLDDPDQRRTMGQLGRDAIRQRLAWDVQEPRYLAAIERLIEPPGELALEPY